jgi:hypothetical protein
MSAAARVTPPLREPVGSFPKPLEAGARSRVGLCAAHHTIRALRRVGGNEGARGCGLGVSHRLGYLREAVRCVPSMFDSLGVQVPCTT